MPIKFLDLPAADRLRSLLKYNPETGEFIWLKSRGGRAKAGSRAGMVDRWGYRQIKVDGCFYLASRLAFKIITGRDPQEEIDHIDGDKSNDRYINLREATHAQNVRNVPARRTSRSGLKGVHKSKSGWCASIRANNERYYLGTYKTQEEAYIKYCEAAGKLHEDFARTA